MKSAGSVWAVARHTFAQALRMKIAVAFIVLLAAVLVLLPRVEGDGTLAGRIRAFLSYGVAATGTLLSLVTVLVTARIITSDVQDKQIYLLVAKPLARWQYLLGRWLGAVLLAVVLLAPAGAAMELVAEHLRRLPAQGPIDRRAVETEIFAARLSVAPQPPDYAQAIRERIEKLRQSGQYDQFIEDFRAQRNLSRDQAEQRLLKQVEQDVRTKYETAGPFQPLEWKFQGMKLAGETLRATGTVSAAAPAKGLYRICAPREVLGKLLYGAPIEVDGVRGFVRGQDENNFDVEFSPDDRQRAEIRRLAEGSEVALAAEPTFQFRYQAKAIVEQNRPDTLWRVLEFRGPDGPAVYRMVGEGPVGSPTTVTIPATGALREGKMTVAYVNVPRPLSGAVAVRPPDVQIRAEDVSILYRVGGFAGNFVRAMLLVLVQLAFLAALAAFFSSFLSFPVAAMACLVLLGAGWMVNWLADSVSWGHGMINSLGAVVIKVVQVLMPNLSQTSPADSLVDGLYLSWSAVGMAALLGLAVRAAFYLALGCLIFHRRELARVQV